MKKQVLIGVGAVLAAVVVVIVLAAGFLSGSGSFYYTQIDNSKLTEGEPRDGVIDVQGGMPYSYTLSAYDEKGAEKDITFGTSRELREGAFLQLTVSPIRGVVEWSELTYEELPVKVQERYDALGIE